MPSLQSARDAIRSGHAIVFFDGYCNLCNRLVRALLRADTNHALLFAPLSGQTAAALGINSGNPQAPTALCVVSTSGAFYGADAVSHLGRRLHQPLGALKLLTLLPSALRNPIYKFIADNRYKWFGKSHTCHYPSPNETDRFLP